MSGRHSRPGRLTSPAGIIATIAVGSILVIGGTVGGLQLVGGATDAAPAPTVSSGSSRITAPSPAGSLPIPSAGASATSASATPASSPTASQSPQRASRSSTRSAAPPITARPSASIKPTPQVIDSGSCGASFYDEPQPTANGESFDAEAMTAAHKTLPFNTRVRVTNPANGESVVVRINDRGPYIDGRCLDLSRAAFAAIASLDLGAINVRYEVLG